MSISRELLEGRFAEAIRDYVAASGRVRLAELELHAETTSGGAARAAAKWRSAVLEQQSTKKALGNVERSFNANGGRLEAVVTRLETAYLLAPGCAA